MADVATSPVTLRHRVRSQSGIAAQAVHATPAPGQMDLVVAWADEELYETRLAIPTDGIIDAIERVGPIWTD